MRDPSYNSPPCVFQEEAVGWAVSTGGLAIHGSEAFTAWGTMSWSDREGQGGNLRLFMGLFVTAEILVLSMLEL